MRIIDALLSYNQTQDLEEVMKEWDFSCQLARARCLCAWQKSVKIFWSSIIGVYKFVTCANSDIDGYFYLHFIASWLNKQFAPSYNRI